MTSELSTQEKKYTLADIEGSIASPYMKFIYKLIKYPLEGFTGIRRLNQGYDRVTDLTLSEVDFIYACAGDLGVRFDLPTEEEIRPYREIQGPLVIVSNHPFGGIESFLMVPLFKMIRGDFWIIANFLLLRIRELKKLLFSIDPYETNDSKKKNVTQMKRLMEYLKKGGMLHIFPSGEVSSYKLKEGRILDPVWNPNICKMIQRTNATVVPLYFHGRNSLLFQIIGFLNPYIRTVFLPREFVYSHEKVIRYKLGPIISAETIKQYKNHEELAAFLREETYKLREHFTGK